MAPQSSPFLPSLLLLLSFLWAASLAAPSIITTASGSSATRRLSQDCTREAHAACRLDADLEEPVEGVVERVAWGSEADQDEPLNPPWTKLMPCRYGELPGTWLPHMGPIISDFNNVNHTVVAAADMGIGISHTLHGGGWQLFDPRCQLYNYLHDYLMLKPVPAKEINILFLGDSVDRHPIVWIAALMEILHNGTDQAGLPPGYSYSLGQVYIRTGHGLNLYYQPMYANFHHDDDDVGAAQVRNGARAWREGGQGNPAGVEPDVVVLNAAYWDLHDLASNAGNDQQQMILRPEYLTRWMTAVSKSLKAARREFPGSFLLWRTAPQTRTELETGAPGAWHKEWAFKMHIAQINAAGRQVMRRHDIPAVDLEAMGAGMTPAQADYDLHHPRDFFAMTYINVMLNEAMQYLQYKDSLGGQNPSQH